MTNGGKGSRPRPFSVSNDEYARRWDAIFGRDQELKKEDHEQIQPQTVDKKDQQELDTAK